MSRPQILLVGGIGKLESHYREAAEQRGMDLLYREKKLVGTPQKLQLVLVVPSVISHPLRMAAADCAQRAGCPIVYLRSPSISEVRRAMEAA